MQSSKKKLKFILEDKWTFGIIFFTLSTTKSNGTIHFVMPLKLAEP